MLQKTTSLGVTGGREQVHSYSECPDASDANGGAGIFGVSIVPGVGFELFKKLRVGHLWGDFEVISHDPVYGIDMSAGVTFGWSFVTSSESKPCCSK